MEERVKYLVELGKRLSNSEELKYKTETAQNRNPWFVSQFVATAFDAITNEMLNEAKLNQWLKNYKYQPVNKTIGLIFAGNIPLVGLHDFICCYVAGCNLKIKLSSKDDDLFLFVLKQLLSYYIEFVRRYFVITHYSGYI